MREILFRGKTKEIGEWVQGYLVYAKSDFDSEECREADIIPHNTDRVYKGEYNIVFPCIHETIGQYTGLTDKNGKKIFEGDIVKTESDLWHGENKKERVTRIGEVIYDEKFCQFGLNIKGFSKCFTLNRWKGDFNEVIGNIHDNKLEDFRNEVSNE